jgi:O-antigen/teichoic acid export membrane protein
VNKIKKIANNLISPGETLSQKVAKGGFWVFFLKIVNRGFSLIRLIILARILSPNDFGLMGIALLTMFTLETFSQTGFQAALIQKKKDVKSYLDSAWTVLILRGFILFTILYFIAPYAAIFFDAPKAKLIIQVIGFSMFFGAFTNIGVIYFRKELEFNKEFIYQLSGTLADFIVAVTAVLILKNVWALVLGLLAGNIVRSFVSYLIHPYRPHLSSDLRKAKELFGFGRWILGSSIIVFLATQGDDIFLGKVLGVTALGFYQMAFRFANLPGSEIGVLSRIAFPTYSKLQDNIPKLRRTYLKMVRFITFLSIPFAGGIFVLGPAFTHIFLGEKWMPMISALRILSISGAVRVMVSTGGALFNAVGRPDIDFKMNLARVSTLAVVIYPLTMLWKISGTSLAVLLAVCACIPIWIIGSKKEAKVEIRDYLKIILPSLIGTAIMSTVIFALGMVFNQFELVGFLVSVAVGTATYLSFIFIIQNISDYTVFKDIKFIFNSLGLKNRTEL